METKKNINIWKSLQKVPAGTMFVPLIIGAIITTICQGIFNFDLWGTLGNPMKDMFSSSGQMLLIGLFIAFFVVFCCMNFHRRILSPAFRQFEEDRRESRRRMDELQLERQQMQTELSRLADVCRNESVPDAFQTFVAGIPTLTKTERRIFDGYAAGLRTREIAQQLDIKDSTLRFHNKNIYDKLGVSSLKQLQQFVAILNSGSGSAPDEK